MLKNKLQIEINQILDKTDEVIKELQAEAFVEGAEAYKQELLSVFNSHISRLEADSVDHKDSIFVINTFLKIWPTMSSLKRKYLEEKKEENGNNKN